MGVLNAKLCGVNAVENNLRSQIDSLKSSIASNLEATASSAVSGLSGGLLNLNIDLKGLFTGETTLNDISLQAEIKDLGTFVIGSSAYKAKLATIQARFSTALKDSGLDVLVIAAAAIALLASGKDICDLVPNMTVDSAGNVTTSSKNVLQSNTLSKATDFISAKINSNGAEINLSNAGIKARFDCAVKGVELVLPSFCITVGESSRTSKGTRILIREADVKIENARLECGVSIHPTDHRAGDIRSSDKHLPPENIKIAPQLLCITGSPNGVTVTLETIFDQTIDDTLVPLKESTSKYGELIAKAQRTFPENVTSDGTRVFFKQDTAGFNKHVAAHQSSVKIASQFIDVLSQNKKLLNNDINSTQFLSFTDSVAKLDLKMKNSIIDFENNFSRDITATDKVIDESDEEVRDTVTILSLPNIDIETDRISV